MQYSNSHIIDIATKNGRDIYFVAKSFENDQSRILVTPDIDKAKDKADGQVQTYYVYNSKGQIVYKNNVKKEKVLLNIHEGLTFVADGINVFSLPKNTIPNSCYHGKVTVVSDSMKSDKYRIKTEGEYPIEYWCRSSDIKKFISKNKK